MITIAVDAMGGDHAPRPEVEGAVQAARELGVRILLVGLVPEMKKELSKHTHRGLPIEIVPATEVITMDDSPTVAFRKKKDSSAHVATKLVRTRPGRCRGQRGEYRRDDGRGAIRARHAIFGGPGSAGRPVSDLQGRDGGSAGCGRERGFEARAPCAICGDG